MHEWIAQQQIFIHVLVISVGCHYLGKSTNITTRFSIKTMVTATATRALMIIVAKKELFLLLWSPDQRFPRTTIGIVITCVRSYLSILILHGHFFIIVIGASNSLLAKLISSLDVEDAGYLASPLSPVMGSTRCFQASHKITLSEDHVLALLFSNAGKSLEN